MRGYNESEEAMNWMIDIAQASGLQVIMERDNTFDLGPNYAHAFSTEGNSAMVSTGQQGAVEALEAKAKEYGVEIIYDTKAEQLLREDDGKGRVSGVVASKMDGSGYVKFVAKQAVVLATGDFSNDKEMLAAYCPMVLPLVGATSRTRSTTTPASTSPASTAATVRKWACGLGRRGSARTRTRP